MLTEKNAHQAIVDNLLFEEIEIGASASVVRMLRLEDIKLFAVSSGNVNPVVIDPEFALANDYGEVMAHGMWAGSLFSAVLGTRLPGPGTILVEQSLRFRKPIRIGDTVTATVSCEEKRQGGRVLFKCSCVNQDGLEVVSGVAEILAPRSKVKNHRIFVPEVALADKRHRYLHLLEKAKGCPAVPTAVAHPCDKESLRGPLDAAAEGLIIPYLVGPEEKIRSVAAEFGLDLSKAIIVPTEHSHESAEKAVQLIHSGTCKVLMKGSLHTDELMAAVVDRATGLRTSRRLSHVFFMDVPTYSKPLLITDAAINIAPDLQAKADIAQNAIDLAKLLGVEMPLVAILSAVETVNPKIQSTLDAAALCKMADRKQIVGGKLDGPLAFDNAVSMAAAKTKGIESSVAGDADILLVPDLESGNMVAKQLEYLANAMSAGVVLGARCPIVLTSRADTAETRAASCAIAAIMANGKK